MSTKETKPTKSKTNKAEIKYLKVIKNAEKQWTIYNENTKDSIKQLSVFLNKGELYYATTESVKKIITRLKVGNISSDYYPPNFETFFESNNQKRVFSFSIGKDKNIDERTIIHPASHTILAKTPNNFFSIQENKNAFTIYDLKTGDMQLIMFDPLSYKYTNFTKKNNIITNNIVCYSDGKISYFNKFSSKMTTINPSAYEPERAIVHFDDNHTTSSNTEEDKNSYCYYVLNSYGEKQAVLIRCLYDVRRFDTNSNKARKQKDGSMNILGVLKIDAVDAKSYSENYWSYCDRKGKWHLVKEDIHKRALETFDFTRLLVDNQPSLIKENPSKIKSLIKEQLKKRAIKFTSVLTPKNGVNFIYDLNDDFYLTTDEEDFFIFTPEGKKITINEIMSIPDDLKIKVEIQKSKQEHNILDDYVVVDFEKSGDTKEINIKDFQEMVKFNTRYEKTLENRTKKTEKTEQKTLFELDDDSDQNTQKIHARR